MKPEKVFKRYDVRGKYPEEIDEEFAELLGKSLGTFLKRKYNNQAIVCRDTKETSRPLKDALITGLNASGIDVTDVGIGPTDFAAWCGRNKGCVSVQITSSHMPLEFNGFKFMYPEGNGFVNRDLYDVQDIFRDREFNTGDGKVVEQPELIEDYKKEILDFARTLGTDFNRVIAVESMGGAGRILEDLLEELGADVIRVSPSERPHIDPPDPAPENLKALAKTVEESNAEIGIANDLDADRVALYRNGEFVSGDEIFCILAQLVEGPVVASIDTSKALSEIVEVEHTRVGDPFVMDKAIDIDAEFAGEPNGHYAFTNFVPYHSGILAALILAGLDIDEKLEKVPQYSVKRSSIEVEDQEKVMQKLEDVKRSEIISNLDGVKFQEDDAEVLTRPSGSSSKVRVIAESRSSETSEQALNTVIDLINQF